MNMPILNKKFASFFAASVLCCLLFTQCKKEVERSYEVNSVELLPPNTMKTKAKTNEQYISILYANMFQKALSANQLFEISQCMQSKGDQVLAREVIISNFMNKKNVIIPADSIMRLDIDKFVTETYIRFLVRRPTEGEKTYFRNFITSNANVTPELVYFSFALSDEYMFY
jgi:hypothetical protein